MKKLTALLLSSLLIYKAEAGRVFIIANNGSNSNTGTIAAPWATWEAINGRVTSGDTVRFRGGTYRSTKGNGGSDHCLWQNLIGTASQRIVIENYGIEAPIFNLDNIVPTATDPTALKIVNCQYLTIRGLRITGLKQITSGAGVSRGIDLQNSPNNRLENIELDHIGGYGFILSDGSSNNYFLNCDAHHMDDRFTNDGGAWGNANGFQCTGGSTATNCTFENCRAWWISDDGFDMYGTNGVFTFKGCWAFWNGFEPGTFNPVADGRGFKLGPHKAGSPQHNNVLRTVTNCISFENRRVGFDQNNGDLRVVMWNNTSFKNPDYGYMWDYISPAPVQDFRNNISYMDGNPRRGAETNGSYNSWNSGFTVNSSTFKSISSAGADGPRGSGGSLPVLDFLKLNSTSTLINAGVNVGLPFSSTAPDLGAFETEQSAVNVLPTLSVSGATIQLPINAVTLTATASDIDGTISSYSWQQISGPTTARFSSRTTASTQVSKLKKGRYKFRITVTDNSGGQTYDEVIVTVNGYPIIRATSLPSGSTPGN